MSSCPIGAIGPHDSRRPSPRNGLRKPSQLMVDKLFTVPIQVVGEVVGQLEPDVLVDLDLALRGWLELP